jgi:hypothetical protein
VVAVALVKIYNLKSSIYDIRGIGVLISVVLDPKELASPPYLYEIHDMMLRIKGVYYYGEYRSVH